MPTGVVEGNSRGRGSEGVSLHLESYSKKLWEILAWDAALSVGTSNWKSCQDGIGVLVSEPVHLVGKATWAVPRSPCLRVRQTYDLVLALASQYLCNSEEFIEHLLFLVFLFVKWGKQHIRFNNCKMLAKAQKTGATHVVCKR